MTPVQHRIGLLLVGLSLATVAACRTTPPENPEFDTLLQSVSYDTSMPPLPHMDTVSYVQPDSVQFDSPEIDLEREHHSIAKSVGDGMIATGALAAWGVIKVVEATLGLDDDDEKKKYDSSPRGRADRDRDQWMADRVRWKKSRKDRH